ncbi:hypothetical protein DK867_22165 [Ochrobactrum sp. POC9]|jgi:hypothetical protein|nr:hypothetical protein DK867_22165 [Ochrobactrum sp. POC9]
MSITCRVGNLFGDNQQSWRLPFPDVPKAAKIMSWLKVYSDSSSIMLQVAVYGQVMLQHVIGSTWGLSMRPRLILTAECGNLPA